MKIGDMLYPFPSRSEVALIIDFVSDQYSDRWVILNEGEIFEIPIKWDEVVEAFCSRLSNGSR